MILFGVLLFVSGERILSGEVRLAINSDKPLKLEELARGEPVKNFYERVIHPLEKRGLVKYEA